MRLKENIEMKGCHELILSSFHSCGNTTRIGCGIQWVQK